MKYARSATFRAASRTRGASVTEVILPGGQRVTLPGRVEKLAAVQRATALRKRG